MTKDNKKTRVSFRTSVSTFVGKVRRNPSVFATDFSLRIEMTVVVISNERRQGHHCHSNGARHERQPVPTKVGKESFDIINRFLSRSSFEMTVFIKKSNNKIKKHFVISTERGTSDEKSNNIELCGKKNKKKC